MAWGHFLGERQVFYCVAVYLDPENSEKPWRIEEVGRTSWNGHVRKLPLVVGGEGLKGEAGVGRALGASTRLLVSDEGGLY